VAGVCLVDDDGVLCWWRHDASWGRLAGQTVGSQNSFISMIVISSQNRIFANESRKSAVVKGISVLSRAEKAQFLQAKHCK